ncbi:MAG: VCBS repeat-containing protein [Okeania sp. SIO3I5]|uniref:FG-GAP repeat domain-containing protein n=1 Tax=Okeania sp. SIO3I5 TaxID=2607805 RepID=UPI0013BD3A9D|nr:VCBS repeat-containing protein [Okeania sp. SIO3I5]NEQ38552.1 VCBS repeat-containing protein [Okeania sp. SIO3I5]
MAIDFEAKNPLGDVAVERESATTLIDIDGDNDLDAFVGNSNGTISFFQNIGNRRNPNFRERTGNRNPLDGVDVGSYSKPAFVDIDGDRDLDAFIGNSSGEVIFYENTRNRRRPRFQENPAINPLSGIDVGSYSAPAFVDINQDGDFDVFIGNSDGTISYFENTGKKRNPRFRERTANRNPFDGFDIGSYSAPTFVDIDNDKDFDAFVGNDDGTVELFENTGTRKRPTFSQILGGRNPLFSKDVGTYSTPTFADIDNDKDFDFFVGNSDGTVDFLENIGKVQRNQNRIKKPEFFTNPLGLFDVGSDNIPTLVDIDGDKDLDAVIGNSNGTIDFFENIGTKNKPRFYLPVSRENPFFGIDVGSNSSPAFADIDNDGDLDAFSGNSDGNLIFFENVGTKNNPRFSRSKAIDNPFNGLNGGSYSTPTFIDIDNDGDLDAFSGNSDGNISFLRNIGTKKRPEFALILGSPNPFNGVDVGSFSKITFINADGDRDFDAFIGSSDGTVKYFKNTGTRRRPRFREQTGNSNPFNGIDVDFSSAPTFGDLDGDADVDALVGDGSGFVSFFENTAPPTNNRRSLSIVRRSAKISQGNEDSLLNGGTGELSADIDVDNFVLGKEISVTSKINNLTEGAGINPILDEPNNTLPDVLLAENNSSFF